MNTALYFWWRMFSYGATIKYGTSQNFEHTWLNELLSFLKGQFIQKN